jgi:Ribbon-helix-helix protein, copG family
LAFSGDRAIPSRFTSVPVLPNLLSRITLLPMNVLTCKLPPALNGRLAALARRRGVSKSVVVREAIEEKLVGEAAVASRRPANLIEALGDSVGSIASGKRDLGRNKKHLKGYGR